MSDLEDVTTLLEKQKRKLEEFIEFIDDLLELFYSIDGIGEMTPDADMTIRGLIDTINEKLIFKDVSNLDEKDKHKEKMMRIKLGLNSDDE